MKLYKLTEQDNTTYHGGTVWGENITHEVTLAGTKLCSNQVIHAYKNKYLAIFMNPVHAEIVNPKLWEVEGEIVADNGTKVGVKKLTTIKEIPVPAISLEQKVEIAIRCAKAVYKNRAWNKWANAWLSGEDRTANAAYAAANAANAVAYATYATYAANAANAATAVADAATAVADATKAAANAAKAANAAVAANNLILKIIKEVLGE